LAECKILNFFDVDKRTRTASLYACPLARYQTHGLILPVMSIFYPNILFHQYSIVRVL